MNMTTIPIKYPHNVHLTTVYLTHHTLTSPILTLSVSLTGLVCYVEDVKKVSVYWRVFGTVLISVKIIQITICSGSYLTFFLSRYSIIIIYISIYSFATSQLPMVTLMEFANSQNQWSCVLHRLWSNQICLHINFITQPWLGYWNMFLQWYGRLC